MFYRAILLRKVLLPLFTKGFTYLKTAEPLRGDSLFSIINTRSSWCLFSSCFEPKPLALTTRPRQISQDLEVQKQYLVLVNFFKTKVPSI